MARPYYVYGGNLLNREKYTSVVNTAYGDRRYFSSIDTDVYFGDILIDEMVAFDFMLEEKKIPIFGYNNFTPKRLITGQKSIQGSFAINFTQAFSLKTIIDSLPESLYANDYEEAQFYCADDNKAIFGKGFDITISYGEAKAEGSYNACTQTLVGCHITSYRQAFDTSGEPILDMYTFIAKDLLIHDTGTDGSVAEDEDIITDNDTVAESNKEQIEESGDIWKMANSSVDEEYSELEEYCKEHPETIGMLVNPTYEYTGGKHKICMFATVYGNQEILYDTIRVDLIDTKLKKTYSFTMNQRVNEYSFYYELKGTEIDVGEKIKKLFNTNDFLECLVWIDCNDRENSYRMDHTTILNCGSIENVFNDYE